MAWATLNTFGLMERWRKRFLQQPYQFQQINDGYANYSPTVWIQQEREELAQTLINEIEQFNFWVGVSPLPMYFEEIIELSDDKHWYNQTLTVSSSANLIQFGQQAFELLGEATVTHSGHVSTATLEVEEIESGEVVLIFSGFGSNLAYQIHDLNISYSTGSYSFVGHKSLFVNPELQTEFNSFIDGNPTNRIEIPLVADSFVTTANVYRVYNDPTIQAQLLSVDPNTAVRLATDVTPILQNEKNGEFSLASANLNAFIPYAVKVYFQAGKALESNGNMFTPFETILLRRARVNFPISVKEQAYRTSTNWVDDFKLISESDLPQIYINPLGSKMVDYYTWQVYKTYYDPFRGEAFRYV